MKRNKSSKKKKQVKKPDAIKTLQEDIQEEIDKIDNLPNEIDRLLEQYLPDKDILQTIKEGLTADKVISAMVVSGSGMKDAHSMTKDFVDVPDWSNRLKAADISLRVKDLYPKEKIEVDITGNFPERLAAAIERVKNAKK